MGGTRADRTEEENSLLSALAQRAGLRMRAVSSGAGRAQGVILPAPARTSTQVNRHEQPGIAPLDEQGHTFGGLANETAQLLDAAHGFAVD